MSSAGNLPPTERHGRGGPRIERWAWTGRITYERTGRGRPVVLAGGTGMPPVASELCGVHEDLVRACFEVITYAARGVAPSEAPAAPYAMADLAGLMDALGLTGAAVVGYSLGSFTAELLARTRPDLVASAVLMAETGAALLAFLARP
ncbi:alpha/beta fold hydrolase [Streptomyces sp. MS1.HAVA.3]|uniref:Alpha/beta fold hydrolase n=1 Tax=Streptomyces caledonius TaxID=3134107 RepID=A0ABU8UGF9_9ACTN